MDISVPFSDRLKCIEFFLGEGWSIEGKLGGGFRTLERAILERDSVRYPAPEVVLLFKSNRLSEKNLLDFDAAIDSLDRDTLLWFIEALSLVYENSHSWLKQLEEKIEHGRA